MSEYIKREDKIREIPVIESLQKVELVEKINEIITLVNEIYKELEYLKSK
jgi:hypothetical protein